MNKIFLFYLRKSNVQHQAAVGGKSITASGRRRRPSISFLLILLKNQLRRLHMNHLQKEVSPYLQQHADNPVDWHPWREAALEKAIREDKPILLSIGYSTCHWCHVMERESFQDTEVAAYMNEHFVNIKVDREERPDLDQFYMDACQVISGQAGWPLNLFLTPDRKPFYGGTYFPPEKSGRSLSWFQTLQYAAYNFYEQRKAVEQEASRILRRMQGQDFSEKTAFSNLSTKKTSKEAQALLEQLLQQVRQKQDTEFGGFGQGQKYPNTMALEFLLTYARQFNQANVADHVQFTLDQMLRGGIYDVVEGGWCRYSVDRQWKIPHFEKMLYDNALMVSLMAALYQYEPREAYKGAIEKTLQFVDEKLSNGQGGFFSALDADSEGKEGAYYTWTKKEIEEVLGPDAASFNTLMDIRLEGNWEDGRNILQLVSGGKKAENVSFLESAYERLLNARKTRKQPHRDEKILLSWNALQAMAYMDAYAAVGTEGYKKKALEALAFLREHLQKGSELMHAAVQAQHRETTAFLSDYAFYIEALIKGYTLDWDTSLLESARHWMAIAVEKFYDEKTGLFFFSEKRNLELPFLYRDKGDAELPSAGAVMVANLKRLAIFFEDRKLDRMASRALEQIEAEVAKKAYPMASWASLLVNEIKGWKELAITGPEAFAAAKEVQRWYLPGMILMAGQQPAEEWPLLKHRFSKHQTRFFLCENYSCKAPVFSVEELKSKIT